MNTICIIACHSDSDIKKDTLKHNLKYLKEISCKIVIVGSSEFPIDINYYKDDDFEIEILYFANDNNLCYKKYFGWFISENIDNLSKKYNNFILVNDSIVITKSLYDFADLFLPNIEMTGIVASNELAYHYPDFLRRYNIEGLKKIMSVIQENLYKYSTIFDLIVKCEVNSMCIFTTHTTNVLYKQESGSINIHYDTFYMEKYLFEKNYPIIKLKKILYTEYDNNFIPIDFNRYEYLSLNKDLNHCPHKDLKSHFIKHGINEGRHYKKNQPTFLCKILKKYISINPELDWIYKYKK
jgi:hypothetical protein